MWRRRRSIVVAARVVGCSSSWLLFCVFWEVMLVPMYFLIGIWGHEQRHFAALKFFIFTQASSLLMLLARVIEGASHLAIVVAAPSLITQLSQPRYVGAAMTLWSTFFGVSFVSSDICVVIPVIAVTGIDLNKAYTPLYKSPCCEAGFCK